MEKRGDERGVSLRGELVDKRLVIITLPAVDVGILLAVAVAMVVVVALIRALLLLLLLLLLMLFLLLDEAPRDAAFVPYLDVPIILPRGLVTVAFHIYKMHRGVGVSEDVVVYLY